MPQSTRSTVVFSAARVKPPVRVLITSNGTLATAFAAGQVHQSVTLAQGDRICLGGQSTATENGIYIVNASGAPTRASDLPVGALASGVSFAITNGTHKGKIYVCTNADGSDTVGTDALTFGEPPITVAWGDVGGTLSDQTDLQAALDAKAASSHNHAAGDIDSGTLAHEQGGLEADVSAYDGLVRITGGATSEVPVTAFALTVLDDSDAATVRATIGAASSAEVSAITSSYSRRLNVIARVDNTAAPPTEVSGDRYLLDATGASHGDWDGAAANDIVEFDGSSWVATSPVEGWIVYSDGSDTDWLYIDDGSPAWQERTAGGGVTDHGALTGLADDDHSQYALADGTRWTTTATTNRAVISDGSGTLVVSTVTDTELGHVSGVTSSIQTQLDNKAASSHTHDASTDLTGLVPHENGGLEVDISSIDIGDIVAGTGTGTVGIITATGHSDGDVLTIQADGSIDFETPAGGGGGGGLTTTAKTAGYTAAAGDLVSCDATSGAFTITMPASPTKDDKIGIYLEHGSFTLKVTIQGNGKTLAEFGSAVTLQTPGDLIVFQYDGTKWLIAANGIQVYSHDLLSASSIDEDDDGLLLYDGSATEDYEKRATVKSMLAPYREDSTLGTDAGDIIYRPTANDHWTNLKIGNDDEVLKVVSGLPAWGESGITRGDGTTWTARSASEANTWLDITYGNGLFVATAESGTNRVMTSQDGINWTARSAANSSSWRGVTFGNGLFVAVGYTGTYQVMTSPDGITWTSRTASENNVWRSVVFGDGLYVAVSNSGTNRVMSSSDGTTWTARSAAEANGWMGVTHANGLYVAVSNSGTNRVMTSPDGVTWTARSAAEANQWYDITYGNGLFVAVALTGTNRVMTSPDGVTWTARSAATDATWYAIEYGNGLFVAVALDGSVMTSPDGITWTERTESESNAWNGIAYGNGLFVAVSSDGTNRVMTAGKQQDRILI